jgi:hypothetical protein
MRDRRDGGCHISVMGQLAYYARVGKRGFIACHGKHHGSLERMSGCAGSVRPDRIRCANAACPMFRLAGQRSPAKACYRTISTFSCLSTPKKAAAAGWSRVQSLQSVWSFSALASGVGRRISICMERTPRTPGGSWIDCLQNAGSSHRWNMDCFSRPARHYRLALVHAVTLTPE